MNSHRTNNTSPRGLQRPQRQAEKPDYLHDSPTNVYFLSLSVVFSLRCKPWPDDQSCYQNEGSEPENYTCQSSVKNEITAECAGICPKGYPFQCKHGGYQLIALYCIVKCTREKS